MTPELNKIFKALEKEITAIVTKKVTAQLRESYGGC